MSLTSGAQYESNSTTSCLQLFGIPQLKDASGHTLSVRGRKSIALLAYLSLTSPKRHSREKLAGMFWPTLNDKNARNNLRVSISRVAKILDSTEQPLLSADRLTLALEPRSVLSCDVTDFKALLHCCVEHAHADSQTCKVCHTWQNSAIALYTADFMEGFHLDGCEEFGRWQQEVAEQLRSSAVAALCSLAQHSESVGDNAAAERYSHLLLNLAPYNEAAHRCLMTALVRRGDRTGAAKHYLSMQAMLLDDLGVVPDETTQKLASSIENGELAIEFDALPSHQKSIPVAQHKHNLLVEKSPYIGNGIFLEKLTAYVQKQRLVTLSGIGGWGKPELHYKSAVACCLNSQVVSGR